MRQKSLKSQKMLIVKKVGNLTIEKNFLKGKLVSLASSKERKNLLDTKLKLSINRQCSLLKISKSSLYYEPVKPFSTNRGSLKYEEIYLNEYKNMKVLRKAIEKYIFKYNTKRLHSAIDYQTPNEVYYQSVNNLDQKGEKRLPKAS